LGVHPDLFYVAFIGQSVVAASQVFILSLPAKLAAVWFGSNQVSSACSIGVFGNQVSVKQ
jgi:FLVCR family feline leukemia virus subgroup C receptor-related protein